MVTRSEIYLQSHVDLDGDGDDDGEMYILLTIAKNGAVKER